MTDHRDQRLAIVGFGSIGRTILACLRRSGKLNDTMLLVRPGTARARTGQLPTGVIVADSRSALQAHRPTLVVEAAGHQALADLGPAALEGGADLLVCSVGALATPSLHQALMRASEASRGRVLIPSGAVAGIDALRAARVAGIDSVQFTSIKPAAAWKGTAAEEGLRLDELERATTFFQGTARDAALLFPKNANVTATIALAGLGLDETQVELVADPKGEANRSILDARGAFGRFRVEMNNLAAPGNPRTSALAAVSAAAVVLNMDEPLAFVGGG